MSETPGAPPLPPPGRGPLDRAPLGEARRQQRTAWTLAIALLVVLGGLYLWSQRLGEAPKEPSPDGGAPAAAIPAGLQADGEARPGAWVRVAFGDEGCAPWHVTAAEAPPSADMRLLVLTSPLSDPEGFALAGLGESCGPNLTVRRVEALRPGELAGLVAGGAFRALIALGPPAVAAARAEAPGLHLLYALVPNPVGAGLGQPGIHGVSPWVPMLPLARHLDTVLPRSKPRLAVVYAEPFRAVAEEAARALTARGRRPVLVPLAGPEGLEALLASLEPQIDGYVVLPDREVIDQALFTRLQVAAERAKMPLCTSDEEHVRAGAYAGAGTDLHRIGAQLCRLAGALERGTLAREPSVFCPEYSFAALNEMAVQKLGYLLDPGQLGQVKLIAWH